jgi:eukaryotic-like serine/threonine-protein kinase
MGSAALGPNLGPYRVVRTLGTGGMGTVLLAEDTRLGRLVALKTFSGPEAETPFGRQQMLREARAAATLGHPHIAAVHDVLDIDGRLVIVFEYVEGETLSSRIARGPLPVADALEIARQLADALDAAHSRGIVHRDLKPSNVILTKEEQVKVLDFGIARSLNRDPKTASHFGTTVPGALIGTPGYAAPEQWIGQPVDGRADLYALGVVLFEMVAGRRPFGGSNAISVASAVLQGDAPLVSSVATEIVPDLDRLIASALARDPAERPASAREFETALERLQSRIGEGVVYEPPTMRTVRTRPLTRASIQRWWPAAAVLVVGIGIGLASLFPSRGSETVATPTRPPVVAVLPLTNASGDSDKDYLAAGVGDSLITSLASLPSVTVLSRRSVLDARTRQSDPAGLARDLDAAYLVDGSVQQAGTRLRIALTLLRPDGSVRWGDSVEGLVESIFDLQARLAGALGEALQVELSAQDRARLELAPTSNSDALQAYWQGRALLDKRDPANIDAAIAAFSQAVTLDPKFAIAYAALGEAYWERWTRVRDAGAVDRAIEAGTTALQLDSNRPEVHHALAITLSGSGKLEEAISALQRALALRPNYDDARRRLGQVLEQQGKIDEATAEFRKALALRPNSWITHREMGLMLYRASRYTEAIEAFKRVAELRPDNNMSFQQLGTVYQAIGDTTRALEYYHQANTLQPTAEAYSNIGNLQHQRGDYAGAIEAYQQAIGLRPSSHITHRNLGDAYRRVNLEREARASYQRAVQLVEAELRVNPNDGRNLASKSVYLEKLGDDRAARVELARALERSPTDVQVLYRSAVVHALGGRPDAALHALQLAIERGYSRAVAETDEDLESIRTLPGYKTLIEQRTPGERE